MTSGGHPGGAAAEAAVVSACVGAVLAAGLLQQVVVLGVPAPSLGLANFLVPAAVGGGFGALLVRIRRLRRRQDALLLELALRERELAAGKLVLEREVDERTRELREAYAQLAHAQKLEAVGRMAGSVAHDFANMLTIVNICADQLRSSVTGDARASELVGEVLAASERAASISKQLLQFARKDPGRLEPVELVRLVRNVRPMLERLLGEAVTLDATRLEEACVRADPGQLEQVLVNLVANARDAGARHVTIDLARQRAEALPPTVRSAASSATVRLAITDDGGGMPEEVRVRALDPFYTTKAEGAGTGLGLSAAYGIVRAAGGDVVIESTPGSGTTVAVFLPPAPA
ncbi:MAG: ATP-binding protein [Polyangiaceae bacterium]|nr:ATP-binding protein [Polyangiaceae bacterium]